MAGWKYSKQRLQKNPYVAKVIRTKKVICICGVTIKLSRKWDEDYINQHARSKGYKRDKGQKILYHYFNRELSGRAYIPYMTALVGNGRHWQIDIITVLQFISY